MLKFGMCFNRNFKGSNPLDHIGKKRPTYIQLFELANQQGWEAYVVTRKTYKGQAIFDAVWKFKNGGFEIIKSPTKMDLIFDWVGNLKFPPKDEPNLKVVNIRKFKELCWNKWIMYSKLAEFMPKTFWVGEKENIENFLPKINTEWVVVKPFNGLKGRSVYVGPRKKVKYFEFNPSYKNYIAQEFIDTSTGIPGITSGFHDLRVVIANKKPIWCHVRVPQKGTYKANVGQGGSLTEVDYNQVPESVKKVVKEVSQKFFKEFDNPIYSLDFGLEKEKPYIFEVNDQIGFPLPDAKGKDNFLNELIDNFKSKIT